MSTALKMASPLMWVGGKHASAKRIVTAFPSPEMYDTYVEVFVLWSACSTGLRGQDTSTCQRTSFFSVNLRGIY